MLNVTPCTVYHLPLNQFSTYMRIHTCLRDGRSWLARNSILGQLLLIWTFLETWLIKGFWVRSSLFNHILLWTPTRNSEQHQDSLWYVFRDQGKLKKFNFRLPGEESRSKLISPFQEFPPRWPTKFMGTRACHTCYKVLPSSWSRLISFFLR